MNFQIRIFSSMLPRRLEDHCSVKNSSALNSDKQPLADKNPSQRAMWKDFNITNPACLALFSFLACITERKSMSADPLNFNVYSLMFEVIRQVSYPCTTKVMPIPEAASKHELYRQGENATSKNSISQFPGMYHDVYACCFNFLSSNTISSFTARSALWGTR